MARCILIGNDGDITEVSLPLNPVVYLPPQPDPASCAFEPAFDPMEPQPANRQFRLHRYTENRKVGIYIEEG